MSHVPVWFPGSSSSTSCRHYSQIQSFSRSHLCSTWLWVYLVPGCTQHHHHRTSHEDVKVLYKKKETESSSGYCRDNQGSTLFLDHSRPGTTVHSPSIATPHTHSRSASRKLGILHQKVKVGLWRWTRSLTRRKYGSFARNSGRSACVY